MQLYVNNKKGNKVKLDISASTRNELAIKIGYDFTVDGQFYNVNDVYVEPSNNNVTAGTVIGGLLGLLGGGVGVLIGGAAGGLIGGLRDKEERNLVEKFNSSKV